MNEHYICLGELFLTVKSASAISSKRHSHVFSIKVDGIVRSFSLIGSDSIKFRNRLIIKRGLAIDVPKRC